VPHTVMGPGLMPVPKQPVMGLIFRDFISLKR